MKAVRKLLDPIMDMLQMVDNDTRQIGKILRRYDEMIVRCFSACAAFDTEQDAVVEVFDRRRTMFKSPTHVAAMMLDPKFRDRTLPDDDDMHQGWKAALIQFGYPESSDQHKEVLTAIDKFHVTEPPFHDVVMDRAARSYNHPTSFWESKEKRFPHTVFFAGRILRVWATTSPCESAWSCRSFIHSKSRNRSHPYGSWVHYWQQLENELPTDQQPVSGRGAHTTVMQEELMHARERMHVVSHMGPTRRLRVSHRRRCCSGGHGGGRHESRGQGGCGGAGGRRSIGSRRLPEDGLVRKPRQRWDEGNLLYESSSSDDEDFFGTGGLASDADNDLEDRHPNKDDDDGARGDDRGDGGDRSRPRSTHGDGDRGADEAAGDYRDESDNGAGTGVGGSRHEDGDRVDDNDGAGGDGHGDGDNHAGTGAVGLTHLSTLISPGLPHVSPPCPHQVFGIERGPVYFDEFRGDTITLPTTSAMPTVFRVGRPHEVELGLVETTMRHCHDAHRSIAQPSLSDSFDGAHSLGGAEDGGFAACHAVDGVVGPPCPPSHSEPQPIGAAAGAVAGVPATDTTNVTQQPVAGSSAIAPRDRATILPNVAFYTSGTTGRGVEEQGVGIVCRSAAPFMGIRSTGTVDGARHTTMIEYEARHGSTLLTTTPDVQATRAVKASLSRTRKKAAARKASHLSPHMRSHLRRPGPADLEDGEIAPESDALDVGGRTAAMAELVGREGAGGTMPGEKRRDSVLIVHDDNTDVAPGETRGTDDAGDSDYVPKVQAADGDGGGGRRVRRRTRLGPHGQGPQGTPSMTIPALIDRRARMQQLLRKMEVTLQETHGSSFGRGK
ncbi:hypothetical protein CBR_g20434 [Chara braunii]|uniref:HAT C-terminal dimerisation domain-containing protein n=1 Tax=Chara braunii TaxID=69332 RepID=A0A388JUG6_CHABU|nr:hypothetical protein CBR_g20434 [Chara braunii]|eukprot:GBG61403.1 hypothetical protein CBR_g20434 [Chara braunii]